jgi:hypothetical protein
MSRDHHSLVIRTLFACLFITKSTVGHEDDTKTSLSRPKGARQLAAHSPLRNNVSATSTLLRSARLTAGQVLSQRSSVFHE